MKPASHDHRLRAARSSSAAARTLRAAARGLTPVYDKATGTSSSLVKMRMHTPTLVATASPWMTGMSITISTAKPTTLVSSAARPAMNRRRKV